MCSKRVTEKEYRKKNNKQANRKLDGNDVVHLWESLFFLFGLAVACLLIMVSFNFHFWLFCWGYFGCC